mgnify:CR=1 FL=1
MIKYLLTILLVTGLFLPHFASNDDPVAPLPTLGPEPVSPQYNWRDHELILWSEDTNPETTIHCLWPGSTCRFTSNPD